MLKPIQQQDRDAFANCKKIFIKKYGVIDSVFTIDAIDGKKWVNFITI